MLARIITISFSLHAAVFGILLAMLSGCGKDESGANAGASSVALASLEGTLVTKQCLGKRDIAKIINTGKVATFYYLVAEDSLCKYSLGYFRQTAEVIEEKTLDQSTKIATLKFTKLEYLPLEKQSTEGLDPAALTGWQDWTLEPQDASDVYMAYVAKDDRTVAVRFAAGDNKVQTDGQGGIEILFDRES